ncbi:unnamed protein product [Pieris macdunnoughi]|uniref:Uncharacterized protein n=1 Tax=Pieris macdunnoughi TaxID=345717 RepID=A0A821WNF3_9NEOP|nr:unnamed protein product [Pieris macdunnoughi]
MGSGKFGFNGKKDKVEDKTEFSVKEKCRKLKKKLKKTDETQKTESVKEKTIWWNQCSGLSEIDQYLWMVGGSAGALALTGVAAASAFYLTTRPKPEKPLVTLHEQSLLEPGTKVQDIQYKNTFGTAHLRAIFLTHCSKSNPGALMSVSTALQRK